MNMIDRITDKNNDFMRERSKLEYERNRL
jgi:hypothetical protein